jgi:hypothetical protein
MGGMNKEEKKPPCFGNPTRLCYKKAIELALPDYLACGECLEKFYSKKSKVINLGR